VRRPIAIASTISELPAATTIRLFRRSAAMPCLPIEPLFAVNLPLCGHRRDRPAATRARSTGFPAPALTRAGAYRRRELPLVSWTKGQVSARSLDRDWSVWTILA